MLDFIQLVFGFIYDLFTMLFTISLGPFSLGSMFFGLLFLSIVIQFMRKIFEVGDNSDPSSSSKKN